MLASAAEGGVTIETEAIPLAEPPRGASFCIPLLDRDTLLGILYVERDHLAPPRPVQDRWLLRLLLAQAVVSLKHARLYATLMRAQQYMARSEGLGKTGSFSWNLDLGEVFWSDEVYRIYGRDPALGVTMDAAFTQCHPDDAYRFEAVMKSAEARAERLAFEHRLLMPDGAIKHLSVLAHLDSSARGLEYVGAVHDITDRKRADENLQATRIALTTVSRAALIGELAASIAHEIRQPIAAATMNGSALMRWLSHEPPNLTEARAAALQSNAALLRAAEVVARIRALFQESSPQKRPVDLVEALEEVLAITRTEVEASGVVVRSKIGCTLPLVEGDRTQLQQVMVNLVLNAVQATRTVNDRPREVLINGQHDEGGRVRLDFRDTGHGLAPHIRGRLFEPFQTTKEGGMGIGLSISRRIVEDHGGEIGHADNEGPGATSYVVLPASVSAASPFKG